MAELDVLEQSTYLKSARVDFFDVMHVRAHAKGAGDAIRFAERQRSSPRVMQMLEKAAVAIGSIDAGTWGSELAYIEPASRGFLALLPPFSSFDRLAADKAFTPMPLHTRLGVAGPLATMASSVGENVLKPMMRVTVSAEIMPVRKVVGTVAYTRELQVATQGSAVSDLFQSMMAQAVAKETDRKFLDIISQDTNITATPSSGVAVNNILADIGTAAKAINDGIGVGSKLYCIMSPSLMVDVAVKLAGGVTAPNLGVTGGLYLGITFIRSDAAGADAIVLDGRAVGADPGIAINRESTQTSLIMDDAPSGYHTVSLFQNNLIAERVERYFGACVLKPEGIAVITGMGST
jgi:hypothetical protein